MTVRRAAPWQRTLDDRILEHLRDASLSTARRIERLEHVRASEGRIRERCRLLADAGLVAFVTDDRDLIELTTWGRLYLAGEVDVACHPQPTDPIRRRTE